MCKFLSERLSETRARGVRRRNSHNLSEGNLKENCAKVCYSNGNIQCKSLMCPSFRFSSEHRLRGRSENGAKSASQLSSSTPPTTNGTTAKATTATNRLMTRFRVPLSGRLRHDHHRGRGPSKEDREVMDTGRIKRWREKREQVSKIGNSILGGMYI